MERNLFTPIISKKLRVAFLNFQKYITNTPNERAYINRDKNFGVDVLGNELLHSGYDVQFTDIQNAYKYDIILISLTSNIDMIYLYWQLGNNTEWGNRKFKVIAGGFGMQNYIPIHEIIDYAWFGRAENEIVWLLDNNLDVEHPSLIKVGKHKSVIINQVDTFYNKVYHSKIGFTKEKIYGCPNKCFFCHYTFSRKYIKSEYNSYVFDQGYKSSIEIEQCKKELYTNFNIPKITTSIDGYSERLRFAVNKKISNDQIIDFFKYISEKSKCKRSVIILYNISGYETENDEDYEEFKRIINKLSYRIKKPIYIELITTPLNPSPITPIAYAAININIDYRSYKNKIIYKDNSLFVRHSLFLESRAKLLDHTIPIRTTYDNIHIFKHICSDKYRKLNADKKFNNVINIDGINDIIRSYDINEELPTQYVNCYISYEKLRRLRVLMLKRLGL